MSLQSRKNVSWKLTKKYEFDTFVEAIQFANHVAMCAQEINHHPDILIQYNKVTISSNTHSANNTITPLDHDLATEIDTTREW